MFRTRLGLNIHPRATSAIPRSMQPTRLLIAKGTARSGAPFLSSYRLIDPFGPGYEASGLRSRTHESGAYGPPVIRGLGADLQRNSVGAGGIRDPNVKRRDGEDLVDLVLVLLAQRIVEDHVVTLTQGGQTVEDVVATGPRPADTVARDVSVGTRQPGVPRPVQVHRAQLQSPLAVAYVSTVYAQLRDG